MPLSKHNGSQIYRVAWFISSSESVPDATLVMQGGRLQEIGTTRHPNAVDLGAVAVVPGLVNAHTHLEFSLLREPIPTAGRFTDWIRSVVKYRREHPGIASEAVRAGIDESVRTGTTLIGDIATTGWSANDYVDESYSGVVFQELLGLTDERVAAQIELAHALTTNSTQRIEASGEPDAVRPRTLLHHSGALRHPAHPRQQDGDVLLGLSPHAPYSVHPGLLRDAISLSRQNALPLAMHLAETKAELELLADATGEFREMLDEFGLWREELFGGGRRPLDYLAALAEAPASLIVHGNYLDEEELMFLAARPHMTLVYCPRTHAAFGHRDHPWRRLRELGGSVALGTDSRASNPDLSLFAELQFLAQQHPDISHLELLELATTNGRRALRPGNPGTDAPTSFTVIELTDPRFRDPARDLFAPHNQVVGTMIDGHWRFLSQTQDLSTG